MKTQNIDIDTDVIYPVSTRIAEIYIQRAYVPRMLRVKEISLHMFVLHITHDKLACLPD